jgi:hypothetical protein
MLDIPRSARGHAPIAGVTLALVALFAAACGPAPSPSNATGEGCNVAAHQHDEATNATGPGTCTSDCECDGMRTCSFVRSGKGVGTFGVCQGTARPGVTADNRAASRRP